MKKVSDKNYDDIINHKHYQSATRPHMSNRDRAAQFAPFAALTGYDDLIVEEARTTDKKLELEEAELERLDLAHQTLKAHIAEQPLVSVTYFVKDNLKQGGKYVTKQGNLKKIDEYSHAYIFTDGIAIPIVDITEIKSELFSSLE